MTAAKRGGDGRSSSDGRWDGSVCGRRARRNFQRWKSARTSRRRAGTSAKPVSKNMDFPIMIVVHRGQGSPGRPAPHAGNSHPVGKHAPPHSNKMMVCCGWRVFRCRIPRRGRGGAFPHLFLKHKCTEAPQPHAPVWWEFVSATMPLNDLKYSK